MKLIKDTMMTNGKWSAKRITAFSSFSFSCILPTLSLFFGGLNGEIALLAGEFLTASLVCLGITTWQHVQMNSNTTTSDQEIVQINQPAASTSCLCGKV